MNKNDFTDIIIAGLFTLITFLGCLGAISLFNFFSDTNSSNFGYNTMSTFNFETSYIIFTLLVYGTVFSIGCGAYSGYIILKERHYNSLITNNKL